MMHSTTELNATVQGVHKKTLSYYVAAMDKDDCELGRSEIRSVYTRAKIGQASTPNRHHRLGNQTGHELKISSWIYTPRKKDRRHYTMMIRLKDPEKAEKLAYTVERAIKGNSVTGKKYVGWSMRRNQRCTFYHQLKKVGFDIDKLKTKCCTSCTRLALVGINAAGIKFPYNLDSYNLRKAAKKKKKYMTIYTDSKYLKTYVNLQRGDILCDEPHHTVIVL